MTKREIITALLNKEIPERMGVNESFWPHIVNNAWGEQGMEKGTNFTNEFNLDYRSIHWCGLRGPRPDLAGVVEETEETTVRRDAWGAVTRYWKKKAGTPEHVDFTLTSVEAWVDEFRDALKAMDPTEHIPVEELKVSYAEAKKKDEFFVYSGLFVFEYLRVVLGDQFMLESLLLEKEFVHEFNTLITDKIMTYYEFIFKEVGVPDGMHVFDDLGYTQAAFASPDCHREMIHPYHTRYFDMLKSYGCKIILHTCGDFRVHLDSIVESGADCIQALEAKTGMNVVEMAEQYKDKLCFMGNINVMELESGDRSRIEKEVLRKINGMKKMRAPYIFMSDHSIPPSVALEDYRYALQLYRDNCSYT